MDTRKKKTEFINDIAGRIAYGVEVVVFPPETGMSYRGRVTAIDEDGVVNVEYEKGGTDEYEYGEYKPIYKRLNTITESEKKELYGHFNLTSTVNTEIFRIADFLKRCMYDTNGFIEDGYAIAADSFDAISELEGQKEFPSNDKYLYFIGEELTEKVKALGYDGYIIDNNIPCSCAAEWLERVHNIGFIISVGYIGEEHIKSYSWYPYILKENSILYPMDGQIEANDRMDAIENAVRYCIFCLEHIDEIKSYNKNY